MIGYNHRNKVYIIQICFLFFIKLFQELYTWDKGNQLTYPVRYHELDYNSTDKDDKTMGSDFAQRDMPTGYNIYH